MKKRISPILNGYHRLEELQSWEQDGFWLPLGICTAHRVYYGHIYPSEPVYLLPCNKKGLSATKLEVVNSHLWWCLLWRADVDVFKGSDCCWKGKGGGVRLSGASGRGRKHDTYHSWEYSGDEVQMHHFYKQLGNFHHKMFKANCIPRSASPVNADSWELFGLLLSKGEVDYKITPN